MAMNHIIRLATHEDLTQIVEIYNSTVASRQSTADLEPVSVASREAWFQAHQKPNRPIYVLANQLDNSVLAWASFSDYYARMAYDMTAEISLYVRHDSRGVGTGKDLLAYMLMKAPSLHIKNVVGVIFAHNHASLHLFAKFGFVEWGRLPEVCDMGNMLADVVILGKRIKA